MSGSVKQFVDFSNNTNNDTGENNAASIQPVANGENANQTVLQRPSESLRQRSEAIKNAMGDTLYLRDSDRRLILAGPGKVSWPGSTTAAASGILTISDALYVLPMLTPGFAQTAPVPPVQSIFGTLHLKRASDSMNSILVTSMRRSYAAGDQINVTVTAGSVFSCTLDSETGYQRTIHIVATASTTLSATITALNGLIPSAPDNTQLVNAALEGGALGSDLLLTTQAKQFIVGNYDGEGHAVTPANLQAFFTANPTSALAEGDTLCIFYDMVSDTASTGGRRQALPENSNTAVPVGSFFNSRVNPEKLVNALPLCKVVNGNLVFDTGIEIAPGSVSVPLTASNPLSPMVRNGTFDYGAVADTTRYGVTDWENRGDLAVNGTWQLSTTSVITNGKSLVFNKSSTSASTARIEQQMELPIPPSTQFKVELNVKQLIAPIAGTYSVILYWGDAASAALSSTTVALQSIGTTDAVPRAIAQTVTAPANAHTLKTVTIEVAGVTSASTGDALVVDDVQVSMDLTSITAMPAAANGHLKATTVDALLLEDPNSYSAGQLAELTHFDRTTPAGEGTVYHERKDQTYDASHLPPSHAFYGRLTNIGAKLLASAADRVKARISTPTDNSFTWILINEIVDPTNAVVGYRIYRGGSTGSLVFTANAYRDSAGTWHKDLNGFIASAFAVQAEQMNADGQPFSGGPGSFQLMTFVPDSTPWADTDWVKGLISTAPSTVLGTADINKTTPPILATYDKYNFNVYSIVDHVGFRMGRTTEIHQNWLTANPDGWTSAVSGSGQVGIGTGYCMGLLTSFTTGNTAGTINESMTNDVFDATNTDSIRVLEFDMSSVQSGTKSTFRIGFLGSSHTTFVDANDALFLEGSPSNANMHFISRVGGVQTSVDTGIPWPTGLSSWRLEWWGGNAVDGARAVLYNEQSAVAITTSVPASTAGQFGVHIYSSTTGTTATSQVLVSPLKFFFNRFQGDPFL